MDSLKTQRPSLNERVFSALTPYTAKLDSAFGELFSDGSRLAEACLYALQMGGKRFRPALMYLIAESLGKGQDITDGAIAVELFHTASLIADDLPCMDDEVERRGKAPLHKVYGEDTALLATYAMIAEGYAALERGAQDEETLSIALKTAAETTGIRGIIGGQDLDLHPGLLDEEGLRTIIRKKTGALFELSFVLGWFLGGGDRGYLEEIKKCAHHFGMAFQIVDDFQDLEEDRRAGKKTNYPLLMGEEYTRGVLKDEVKQLESHLYALHLFSPPFSLLLAYLNSI